MSEAEVTEPTDAFVCFPMDVGVGYVHPLDILLVTDEPEAEACLVVIRSSATEQVVIRARCSAADLHRRRLAAFRYAWDERAKAFELPVLPGMFRTTGAA
jgi:hypothetical protein